MERLFLFLLLCLSTSVTWGEPSVSYYLPVLQGQNSVTPMTKKINAPKTIQVWNFFDGGPFNANVTHFVQGPDAKFRRTSTEPVRLLSGPFPPHADNQEFCDMLLGNQGPIRFDQTALTDMADREYIDENQFDFYLNSSNSLRPEQMLYLETTSWLTSQETLESFGGKIPWERVAEIKAPPGLRTAEVRKIAESGDPAVLIRIRRANLRLVFRQNVTPYGPTSPNGVMNRFWLPWEGEKSLTQNIRVNENLTPISAEFGRASQMPAFASEALELGRFASLIFLHQSWVFRAFPDRDFPSSAMTIFIHSLAKRHTVLYGKILGAQPVVPDQDAKNTLLATQLDKVIKVNPPEKSHGTISDLMALEPGLFDELGASLVLKLYRTTFRLDFDSGELTHRGPFVIRDYSPTFSYRFRHRFSFPPSHIYEEPLIDKVENVLKKVGQVQPAQAFQAYYDDFGGEDQIAKTGHQPIVLSNLNEDLASQNPYYVQNLVAAVNEMWTLRWIPPAIYKEMEFAIATRSKSAQEQALKLGFTEIDLDYGAKLLFMPLKKLGDLPPATTAIKLSEGYWKNFRLMIDLPGI